MNKYVMYSAFIFCVFLSGITQASSSIDNQQLSDMLPTDCHFSANFEQVRRIKNIPLPLQSEGPLFFSCQHGLIWETQSPVQNALIYRDDKQHFSWQPGHIPQPINDIANSNLAALLLSLLKSDTAYLDKKFFSHFDDNNTVTLTPKQEGIEKYLQDITLSKQDDAITILINNETESTEIHIHSLAIIDTPSTRYCQQSLSRKSCELLIDPIENLNSQ